MPRTPPTDPHRDDSPEPSLARRYALPVLLGVVLGLGALAAIRHVVAPGPATESPGRPAPAGAERGTDDGSRLLGQNPGVVVEVPEPRRSLDELREELEAEAAEGPKVSLDPAPCPDGVEDADCLVATLDSRWQVLVAAETATGEDVPTVQAPVGGRLRWPAVSERPGLVTSFVVEADGGVLLLYPNPAGDIPVAEAGVPFDVPRVTDRARMKWNRPGTRRVFVLVSTVPFVAPEGLAAGHVATYYGAGDAAEAFFTSLREQVHADQATGEGQWALGEVIFDVRDDG